MAAAVYGTGTKRKRNEDGGMTEEGSGTPPSPVVDIRGLVDGVNGPDLVKELQGRFRHNIVNVLMLKHRALVEYEDTAGSSNLVTYAAKNQLYVFGQPVSINYGKYEKTLTSNPSSRVVVIRFTGRQRDDITEASVVSAMQRFGTINTVVINLESGLALVEYEDVVGSGNAVAYAAENQVFISGHPVTINYGKNEKLVRPEVHSGPSAVVEIKNLVKGITKLKLVEQLQWFGTISDVVVFTRRALVEFEDVTGSGNLVAYAAENPVYISGEPVSISYGEKNWTSAPPSRTVYIKFNSRVWTVEGVTKTDVLETMQVFGTITNVHMMLAKSAALVEYEDMAGSGNAVAYASENPMYVSQLEVTISYSNKEITTTISQTLPSPVVYIKFEGERQVDEADIVSAMQMFGTIVNVNKMRDGRSALVEYEDMAGSANAVAYAAKNQVFISGHPVSIDYGKYRKLSVPPSRLVYIRFRSEQWLVDGITKTDVVEAMQFFGTINNVSMTPRQLWALVQYEDTTGSSNAVNYAAQNQAYISGLPIDIGYSSSKIEDVLRSPVVFVQFRGERHVDDVTEVDVVAAMKEFGTIRHVLMMLQNRQALVEYNDMTGAAHAVTYAAMNQGYISGHPVSIRYSREGRKLESTKDNTLSSPMVYVQFGGKMPVEDIMEADLVAAMQGFGTIRHVLMVPRKRHAILEFEDMIGSVKAVAYAAKNMVYIHGHPVFIDYSREGQRFRNSNGITHFGSRIKISEKTVQSPVVEIRDVVDGITESKLVEALQGFGTIKHVLMMTEKCQAFVEYEDLTGSGNAVTNTANYQVYISGHPVSINYSKHKNLRPYNNILKFIIKTPVYPITPEVLYTVCKKSGPVQRIVISRTETAVEAMVEFDNVLSAERAEAYLRKSRNLRKYSGCSQLILRIVDANKPTRLNVSKNDQDTWDYTNLNQSPRC